MRSVRLPLYSTTAADSILALRTCFHKQLLYAIYTTTFFTSFVVQKISESYSILHRTKECNKVRESHIIHHGGNTRIKSG